MCGPSRVGKTTLIKKLLLSESLELRSRFGITGPCVKAHGLSRDERAKDIGRVQADQLLTNGRANFTIASRVCRMSARTAATASLCFHCPSASCASGSSSEVHVGTLPRKAFATNPNAAEET